MLLIHNDSMASRTTRLRRDEIGLPPSTCFAGERHLCMFTEVWYLIYVDRHLQAASVSTNRTRVVNSAVDVLTAFRQQIGLHVLLWVV